MTYRPCGGFTGITGEVVCSGVATMVGTVPGFDSATTPMVGAGTGIGAFMTGEGWALMSNCVKAAGGVGVWIRF